MNALVGEPSDFWRDLVAYTLRREGFEVEAVAGLAELADRARERRFDLVMLTDERPEDGEAVRICQAVRSASPAVLVVLSTGDELGYLGAGADDVLPRPVNLELLVARCRVRCARARGIARALPEEGPVRLLGGGQVLVGERSARLSRYEEQVLRVLVVHRGRPVSREDLLRECWGPQSDAAPSEIDVYINRLRRKIEADPSHPRLIVTVRGAGYALQPPSA